MIRILCHLGLAVVLAGFAARVRAQEISVPDPGLNSAIRQALQKPTGPLTEQDLLGLTQLSAGGHSITNVAGLEAARNLRILSLDNNAITNFTLADALTNLTTLDLFNNHLVSFVLSNAQPKLTILDIGFNSLTQCSLPAGLTNLDTLFLEGNSLTNFNLPTGLTHLRQVDLSGNSLTRFRLPVDMTNVATLLVFANQLTNVTFPSSLPHLAGLDLAFNQLRDLALPAGATSLSSARLLNNQLTNLTLLPDITSLTVLQVDGNPLTTLVLSEPLAATNLAATVAALAAQDVQVFTYPLSVQISPRRQQPLGAFRLAIAGPPGDYTVFSSTNLADWSVFGSAGNPLGHVVFTDVEAQFSTRKFYRTLLRTPPTNMVFIPPGTFTMGSPSNDLDHSSDEVPQTSVTLTRGFWIGKYEVTSGEYLSVMNTNPSAFTGDLRIAVSSVSWIDATNYCAKLTERELAAGRIAPGSRYRLPTEAEWEFAARAGTTTRFSYGDDPFYASTTNYAWIDSNANLMAHPVGQKLPNPWGLYDTHGNVWEWCQDWFGPLPGGVQVDPTGPAVSNPVGYKVMRGGAFDYPNSSCRSSARLLFGMSPFLTDWDLGFRVVLVTAP